MQLAYDPPGPVAAAFHQSNDFVRGIKGPVGSGKSSSCCIEIFKRAMEQKPSPDNVRRSRWAAVRNTYGELKSTTIKTWQDWFQGVETMKWDTPIVSTIKLPDLGDGTSLELEVLFLALDRPDDVGKLRSLELTGMWLNEASQLEKAVLDMATQRVGRYPSKHLHGGPSWTGVIMDTNPPDDDSWWWKLAKEEKPDGYSFYDQPGGLIYIKDKTSPEYGKYKANPRAENVRNIVGGYEYYFKQLGGKSDDYIKVFLLGEYGTTMDGKPVYPEFNEKLHVSTEPLKPLYGSPLILGFDFGLTPACIFGQMSPKGQLLILDELVSEDMGIRQFYSECVLPHLNDKYRGMQVFGYGDPAGVGRSQADEKTCFNELALLGFECEPADSNEFVARRESVAYFLQRLTSSGPGMVIDPGCPMIIKGFRGGYRFERLKVSGSSRHKDRPCKDKFSHPHDALQYLCMSMRSDTKNVRAREVEMVAWS